MSYINASSGPQSTNYGRDQNVNNGPGDFFTNNWNIGGDFIRSLSVNFANAGHDAQKFRTLWDAVAGVGASHDAEQQFERGECLPGTREQAIAMIHEWRTSSAPENPPVCWLLGTAGLGKTAIAMSIAKACAADKSLVASFFFFRSDPKRNNPSLLFLSIAHGLTMSIPSLHNIINGRIASDPRILDSRLEEQFQELVVKPSLELKAPNPFTRWFGRALKRVFSKRSLTATSHHSNPSTSGSRRPWKGAIPKRESLPIHHPNLVIIDGLDECSDSETQLRILSTIFSAFERSPYPPLQFLICSRPEAWIREALYSEPFGLSVKHIVLDDDSQAGRDIELYLLHEFHNMTRSLKYRHITFPRPWPSRDVVAQLVKNSCGQFIYVVTVMRWIRADGFHPFEQLHIILKLSPKQALSSPYRPLDNLYHVILSVHPDPETLRHILAAILFLPLIPNLPHQYDGGQVASPGFIEWVLGLPSGQVSLSLRSMHSILHVGESHERIRVHHTSFTDFLHDKARSGDFFLDELPAQHFLLQQWLQNLKATCYRQCELAYSDDQLLPMPYCVLWEAWIAFAQHVPGVPNEVLSDIETLDLSAPLSMVLSNEGGGSEWYRLFQILEEISSWLKTRQSQGNSTAQHVIDHLETVPKHFHIAVPTEIATLTFLKGLSAWMSLQFANVLDESTWDMVSRALNCRNQLLATWRRHDRKILVNTNCTCPTSVSCSSREAITPFLNSDPGYAHFYINLPAACASTLEILSTSLQDQISSGSASKTRSIIVDIIHSRLVSRCPPGDPRVLSAFHRLLSLANDLKERNIPSGYKMETKSWLKTFAKEHNEEVREVWRKYTATLHQKKPTS